MRFHKRVICAIGAVVLLSSLGSARPVGADDTFELYDSGVGCFTNRSYGTGLLGAGTGTIAIPQGPGPVVNAWMEWVGGDDITPNDISTDGGRADSVLEVDGQPVIGIQAPGDAGVGQLVGTPWYSWHAEIGQQGAGIVTTPDAMTLAISGYDTARNRVNNGATVTIVYDTSPCAEQSRVRIKSGIDVYWHGLPNDGGLTDLLVFPIDSRSYDRTATLTLTHAGTDAAQLACRGKAVWMVVGQGAAPQREMLDIVSTSGPRTAGFGVNGGVEILNDPFAGTELPCTPELNQAPDVAYEAGHPYPGGASDAPYRALTINRPNGGALGPEWAVVDVSVSVPANADWVAFQLESEADQNGESGAWGGGASFEISTGPAPAPTTTTVPPTTTTTMPPTTTTVPPTTTTTTMRPTTTTTTTTTVPPTTTSTVRPTTTTTVPPTTTTTVRPTTTTTVRPTTTAPVTTAVRPTTTTTMRPTTTAQPLTTTIPPSTAPAQVAAKVTLPRTGMSVSTATFAAASLMVAGVILLGVGRRRRNTPLRTH